MSISNARANLPKLITKISSNMDRVVITVSGQPKATIVSLEELETLEETAEVLSIPGIKKSVGLGLKQAKKGVGITISELK